MDHTPGLQAVRRLTFFPAPSSRRCLIGAMLGPVSYVVECSECGHRWPSTSSSGRTQCRVCRARVYVDAATRRAAGVLGPTPSRRLAPRLSSTPPPTEQPQARRDLPPRSVAEAMRPTTPTGPTLLELATDVLRAIAVARNRSMAGPTKEQVPSPAVGVTFPPTSPIPLASGPCRCGLADPCPLPGCHHPSAAVPAPTAASFGPY